MKYSPPAMMSPPVKPKSVKPKKAPSAAQIKAREAFVKMVKAKAGKK
jgi:hypothetical protein